MGMSLFSFSEEEMIVINQWWKNHFDKHDSENDGMTGRYKTPKYHLKFIIEPVPRDKLYKYVECNCGCKFGGAVNEKWREFK